LSFTGALAGIRDPGSFNIGPGTRRELTSEQRVMESLPATLQRMVNVQKEMQEIQRQYNESLSEGNIEEASRQMSKTSGQIKILDQRMQDLAMTLQEEGFELSRVLHFNRAIQTLNKTLEEAAGAAEDAAAAEKIRSKFIIETSGALAGTTKLPSITFGKGAKDLTGLERLVKRMPDMAKMVVGLDEAMKSRDRQVTTFTDLEKQYRGLKRSINDLMNSEDKLSGEQIKLRAKQLSKGMAPGEIGIMNAIREQGQEQVSYLATQTDLQLGILNVLKIQADATMGDEEKSKALAEAVSKATMQSLNRAIKDLPGVRRRAEEQATGVAYISPERRTGFFKQPYGVDEDFGTNLGLKGKDLDAFKELQEGLRYAKTELLKSTKSLKTGGGGLGSAVKMWQEQEKKVTAQLLKIGKVREKYRQIAQEELNSYLLANAIMDKTKLIAQSMTRIEEAKLEGQKQQLLASEMYQRQLAGTSGELDKANQILMRVMQHGRMSEMAENFAKTLEDLVSDFKKAEALELDPDYIKTDLTGPFARVGKPGFKTDFEKRREEAQETLGGRPTKDERDTALKELVKIEYDEKEARIKRLQDIEIKNLKRQQEEAEKFRNILRDAMDKKDFPAEIKGQLKKFFNILTSELEVSEEVPGTGRGADLTFRGVPSLGNIKGLISRIKEFSKKEAQKVDYENLKKAFEEGGGKQAAAELGYLGKLAQEQVGSDADRNNKLQEIINLLSDRDLGVSGHEALSGLIEGLNASRAAEHAASTRLDPASARAAANPTDYGQARVNIKAMLNKGDISGTEATDRLVKVLEA